MSEFKPGDKITVKSVRGGDVMTVKRVTQAVVTTMGYVFSFDECSLFAEPLKPGDRVRSSLGGPAGTLIAVHGKEAWVAWGASTAVVGVETLTRVEERGPI
jgi:hypothetical protein